MATTQNTFTGDGSNLGPFSFTFKWLEPTDIKVTVAGVLKTAGTHYNLQSLNYSTKTGGQVLFTAGNAPANGAAIVIYRQTDDTDLAATFYSGSAIRAQDLNNNFIQGLYVTQESSNNAATATTAANTATTTANTALSNSTAAQSTAATALSTANAASASAASAVSTANAASAAAASAVSTANTANTNATAALNAAAEALAYTVVANVAAIPGSPVNGDAIRILNSTGIESFTPLSGLPVGFIGDSGLTVEIYYSSSTSTWVWVRYYATDSDSRYLKVTTAASTYLTQANASSTYLTQANAASTYQTQAGMSGYLATGAIGTTVQGYNANTAVTNTAQSFTAAQRGTISAIGNVSGTITLDMATANNFSLTLNANSTNTLANPSNLAAGQSGSIYISQDSTGSRTLAYASNWDFAGGTAPSLSTVANAVDVLVYAVRSTGSIAATLIKDVK